MRIDLVFCPAAGVFNPSTVFGGLTRDLIIRRLVTSVQKAKGIAKDSSLAGVDPRHKQTAVAPHRWVLPSSFGLVSFPLADTCNQLGVGLKDLPDSLDVVLKSTFVSMGQSQIENIPPALNFS